MPADFLGDPTGTRVGHAISRCSAVYGEVIPDQPAAFQAQHRGWRESAQAGRPAGLGAERRAFASQPAHAGVPQHRWGVFLNDFDPFIHGRGGWAERAADLGWDTLALFACHPTRPLDHLNGAGLLWRISGGRITCADFAQRRRRDRSSRYKGL